MASDKFMQIKADDWDRIFGKTCKFCAYKYIIRKREECLIDVIIKNCIHFKVKGNGNEKF